MTKRLIITREKHELLLIRQVKRQEIGFCTECQINVRWFSVREAAGFGEVSELNIFRQVENGSFHFKETEKGILLICTKSILSKKPGK